MNMAVCNSESPLQMHVNLPYRMAGLPTRGVPPAGLALLGLRADDRLNTPPETFCALLALAALAINSDIMPLLVSVGFTWVVRDRGGSLCS